MLIILVGLFALVPAAMFIITRNEEKSQRQKTRKPAMGEIKKIENEKDHLIYHVEFTDDKDRVLTGRSLPYLPQSTCREGETVNIRYGMDDVGNVLVQIDEQSAVRKEQGFSVFSVLLYIMAAAALMIAALVIFPNTESNLTPDHAPLWWCIFMTTLTGFIFFGLLWQTPFTVLPKWKTAEGEIERFIYHKLTNKSVYFVRFKDEKGRERKAHTIGYVKTEDTALFKVGQKVNIRYAFSLFGQAATVIDEKPCRNENDEKYLPSTFLMIIANAALLLTASLLLLKGIHL